MPETETGQGIVIGGLITAAVGGLVTLLTFWFKHRKESRKDALDETYKLLDGVKEDLERAHKRLDDTNEYFMARVNDLETARRTAELRATKAEARNEFLEERIAQLTGEPRPPRKPDPPDAGGQI